MLPRTALAFLAMTLAVPGLYGQNPADSEVVREAVYGFPATLDPHRLFAPWWAPVFRLGYETPLVCDPNNERLVLRPGLLAEMPTLEGKSGTVLKLTLKEGPQFAPDPCFEKGRGRAVTAVDLKHIFQRHADPAMKSPVWNAYFAGRFRGLDAARAAAEKAGAFDYDAAIPGIEVVSERELTLRLTRPYPQLLALMTMPWFSVVPREAVRRYGSGLDRRTVGSGPYRFDEGASDDKTLRFVARDDYWGPAPQNRGVSLRLMTEVADQNAAFQKGRLDFLDLYPQNRPEFVNAGNTIRGSVKPEGARLERRDAVRVHYLSFGMKNRYLKQRPLRRALSLALDRDDILKRLYRGNAAAAAHLVPPSLPLHPEEADSRRSPARNLDRARRALAAAGYPEGKGLPTFTLDLPYTGEAAEREARLLQRAWRPLGIKVKPRYGSLDEFQSRVRSGCELAVSYWYADYPDPENFFLIMRSSAAPEIDVDGHAPNHGSYASEDYDALYEKSCRLLPGAERAKLYAEMLEILERDCPVVCIAHPREETVVSPRIAKLSNRSRYAFDYARVALRQPSKK